MHEKLQQTWLDSGLELLSLEMPGYQTISVGIFTRVGSRYESPEQEGISHFLEHMLFKGTASFEASEITALVEGTGGQIGAYTSEESVCVYARTFPDHFRTVMDVLLELHTTPAINSEELEVERTVILEEINSNDDQPALHVADLFSRLMFGDHPLGHPIMGRPDQLMRYSRDDLLHHFYRYFTSGNMLIAAAGAVTHEQLVEWGREHEQRFRPGKPAAFLPYSGQQEPVCVVLSQRETQQCHLQFGMRAFGRHDPSCWALRVLSSLMGESMSSRLFQRVREERGLAYQVSTDFELFEETGAFYVQCDLEPEKIPECLGLCLQELRTVAHDGPSRDEVERAQNYVIGHTIQDLEGTEPSMLWYGDKACAKDKWMQMDAFVASIQAVTKEQVQQLAEQLFLKSSLRAALVGSLPEGVDVKKMLSDQLVK